MTQSKCCNEIPSSFFFEILFLADMIESDLNLDEDSREGMQNIDDADEGLTLFALFS
jgi:hypothetical protein